MSERLLSLIPFFYFARTRLDRKGVLFHAVYEWIPALLILFFLVSLTFGYTLYFFLLYYVAFISVYELGYLYNDWQSLKEPTGRRRFEFSDGAGWTILFVALRIGAFVACAIAADTWMLPQWWMWYGTLAVVFTVHNLLQSPALKTLTFFQLAFIRFFSPFIFALTLTDAWMLVGPVTLNYVLFRMLTYMESKAILVLKERQTHRFRIGYYLISLGFAALLFSFSGAVLPLVVTAYYLAAALAFAAVRPGTLNRA